MLNPQTAGSGPSVSALSQPAEAGRSESMREVSEQTEQYREREGEREREREREEVNRREEECSQKEKQLMTLQSTFLWVFCE